MSKIFFDKIPVKTISEEQEEQFRRLVSDIQNEYSKEKAKHIDQLLFDMYNLSPQERGIVGFIEIQ